MLDRAVALDVLVAVVICGLALEAAVHRHTTTLPILVVLSLRRLRRIGEHRQVHARQRRRRGGGSHDSRRRAGPRWPTSLAAACLVLGALLTLIAAIGILRFPDVLTRMHSATKPQVLGLLLILLGLGLRLRDPATHRAARPGGAVPAGHLPDRQPHGRAGLVPGRAGTARPAGRRRAHRDYSTDDRTAKGDHMMLRRGGWPGPDRPYPRGSRGGGLQRQGAQPHRAWPGPPQEAVRRDAPLVVLYAANYSGMTVEPGPGLRHRDPGALEAAEEVTARGVAEALEAHPGLWVVGATEVTSPSRALIEASADAALVVLGSRGYGRVLGALLGSVAFNVAARATCPVIVVKDEAARPPGRTRTHRVVVGTDGSAEAESSPSSFAADRAAAAVAPLRGRHLYGRAPGARTSTSASCVPRLHRIAESAADPGTRRPSPA